VRTGIPRAVKVFYPQRNERDRAVRYYARKLDRLRDCPIVIQYHNSEAIRYRGMQVTCLVSEYVEGTLLSELVTLQPGRRFRPFEALHILHVLAQGLEQIHASNEYHGDVHDNNIIVKRRGIRFEVKLVDFYHWGAPTAAKIREDVIQLVRVLYDAVGGAKHYAKQPAEIKAICCGLRRDLISRRYPTARRLREHLERFEWDSR
jgi:tRNA A-37 threonylcarbamoyl transferase component Bud32